MVKISVLMSVYGGNENHLRKSIESILTQSFKDYEFIIINDGDVGMGSILQEYGKKDDRIHVLVNEETLGLSKSLNIGLRVAKGEYIARMDADDISLSSRLQVQYNMLQEHPECTLCGSWVDVISNGGDKIGEYTFPLTNLKEVAIRYNPLIHPTWMFRKESIMALGGYNERYRYAQDYELLLRLLGQNHDVRNIGEKLFYFRRTRKGFQKLKKQEGYALLARFEAFWRHDYAPKKILTCVKPILGYAIPKKIKMSWVAFESGTHP